MAVTNSDCVLRGGGGYVCVYLIVLCCISCTGIVCETEVLACSSNPCHHSAPCIESTRGFYDCDCLPGYSGENCQYVDLQCEDDSCHQGVCYVTDVNTTSCQCQEGFTGQLCDVDVDECESSPCKHGGACLQPRPATYECRCGQGRYYNCVQGMHLCDQSRYQAG